VQHQQPRLNPQLAEVTLVEAIVRSRRCEAPIMKTTVQRVQQLDHLMGQSETENEVEWDEGNELRLRKGPTMLRVTLEAGLSTGFDGEAT
jgi:hypothetical protein